jgi:hypothetical protein
MNYFIVNGVISIIAASSIAKIKFNNDKNILIIENTKGSSVFPSLFTSKTEYYDKVQEVMIDSLYYQWHKVYFIEYKTTFITFEYGWLTSILPSIKGVKYVHKKRFIKRELSKIFNNIESTDRLLVSDNSSVWRYWYKKQCLLSFIEHGASTYGLSPQSVGLKLYVKKTLTFFFDYNYLAQPESYYLTDAGMKNFHEGFKGITVFSLNIRLEIDRIFNDFEIFFKKKCSNEYNELMNLKRKVSGKKLIVYLPNSAISESDIKDYFYQQVEESNIDIKNTLILIKKHIREFDVEHSYYVKNIINNYYEFKYPTNTCLPAEFLLYLFDNSRLFGTYSSAHLYSYWWINKMPIFVNPINKKVNDLFLSEYKSTLLDFELFTENMKRG